MPTATLKARAFSDRLREAMREQDVSVRALARRISNVTGAQLEQERRRVHRYLAEPPMLANESSRRLLEECLGIESGALEGDRDDEEAGELYAHLFATLRSVVRAEIAASRSREEVKA